MSYNVDNVKVISGDLSITVKDLKKIQKKYQENLPESNFVDELLEEFEDSDDNTLVPIKEFSWSGMGSGASFQILTKIIPLLKGEADLVFLWEYGDSVSGLMIRDGKAVDCEVSYTLVVPKK